MFLFCVRSRLLWIVVWQLLFSGMAAKEKRSRGAMRMIDSIKSHPIAGAFFPDFPNTTCCRCLVLKRSRVSSWLEGGKPSKNWVVRYPKCWTVTWPNKHIVRLENNKMKRNGTKMDDGCRTLLPEQSNVYNLFKFCSGPPFLLRPPPVFSWKI